MNFHHAQLVWVAMPEDDQRDLVHEGVDIYEYEQEKGAHLELGIVLSQVDYGNGARAVFVNVGDGRTLDPMEMLVRPLDVSEIQELVFPPQTA